MTYTSAYSLGPGAPPPAVRRLIIFTCVFSLICALLNPLFVDFFQIQGPNTFFSLSWYGLKSGYLWQPITYLFVEAGTEGVSFGMLLSLFFQMYILWMMGSPLAERIGGSAFFFFYVVSGIITGIATVLAAPAFGAYPFLMGPSGSLLALWMVWTMMHPESDLLFFFLIPVKAKWLFAGVFSAFLLVNLSQGNAPNVIFYLTSALAGYFYGVLAWGMSGPFQWMEPIDRVFESVQSKISTNLSFKSPSSASKIIDIHTGKAFLDDEAFVDAMLTKISQKGENALSWSERRRLRKISEKKK